MASWDDLAGYIRTNYKVITDDGSLLRLLFGLADGRSQSVLVGRATMGDRDVEWAMIASSFADANRVDIQEVLTEASEYVVGGIVQYGETLSVRHAIPLANLDVNEFTEPFDAVILTADLLERKFAGDDRF